MTDITFTLSGATINLRVGAIMLHECMILICRIPDENWWYVPGGRIAVGESSHDALSRELAEEVSGSWKIGQPIASSENFFTLNGNQYQEICLYYAVEWQSDPMDLSTFSHEEFRWVAINDIDSYVIKPDFVKLLLTRQDGTMQHIIHRDTDEKKILK